MRTLRPLTLLALLLGTLASAQESSERQKNRAAEPPLGVRVTQFDIADGILRDGISELSLKNIDGLHLGFEEITRGRIQDDPRMLRPHFSLHLGDRSVEEILEALCRADMRYTWSKDAGSINVYPRLAQTGPTYLLGLQIDHIAVNNIPDPDQALTPLWTLFPEQQIGYMGAGGENGYDVPWTAVFQQITVRQFINRIAEHMGPHTTWVWQGGKDERMFTFVKGGFHTSRPHR